MHVAEARFILQNRLRNFAVYDSLIDFWRKTPTRDLFRGNLLHLPRNFLVALQGIKLTDEISFASYYGQAFVSQSLAYPFLTVQRRLESLTLSRLLCTRGLNLASDYPTNTIGVLRKTFSQHGIVDGIRSLYRGYTCYVIAIMIWMSALPATTELITGFNPDFAY